MKKIISSLILILFLSMSIFAVNTIVGVQIKGNISTKKFVILNLMGYTKGMKVNIDKLANAQNVLMSSGLFSNVYMNLKATNDNYILVVSVEEKNHISPIFDIEKGIGIKENDLFGFGIEGKASLRCFNLSPLEAFFGGYSFELSSKRTFGTPFSFEAAFSDLKRLLWSDSQSKFYYDLMRTTTGVGYMLNENLGFMLDYIRESVSASTTVQFDVDAISLNVHDHPIQTESKRTYMWWNLYLERGLSNTEYTVGSVDASSHYRIIGQIYFHSRFYGVLNLGNVPFTRKFYFGDTYNLKGYDVKEFDSPFMLLAEMKVGVPLTSAFRISKSPELSVYTPELISQLAFVSSESVGLKSFKPSIGLGVKINTPFGVLEPEVFLGKEFGFYLEMK